MLTCGFANEPNPYSCGEHKVMDKKVNICQSHQWVVQPSYPSQRSFEYLQPTLAAYPESFHSPLPQQISPPIVKIECSSPPCPRYNVV
jgi:hypothetical protein